MAYPLHWLCTFGGALSSTGREPEIWQCGVRGIPQDGGGSVIGQDEEAVLDRLVVGIQSWFTGAGNAVNSFANLSWVKLNPIAPDGSYSQNNTHVRDFTAVPGTQAGAMPSWLTICFEWRTARGRGPGSHGRIFPPLALDATHGDTVTEVAQQAYLNSAKDLLRGLEVPAGAQLSGFAPAVVSKQGVAAPITHAVVGDKIDYMAKRRNAIHPIYKSVTYP